MNAALAQIAARSCTLDEADRAERGARFRALFARGNVNGGAEAGLRLHLPVEPGLAAEAAELAALETQCCPVSFTLEIGRDELVLVLRS